MPASKHVLASLLVVALTATALSTPGAAQAETLKEALAATYSRNPTLDGARARLRATDELVPQALSGYRPRIEANANAGRSWTKYDTLDRKQDLNPAGMDLSITQPLYQGGATQAATQRATNLVLAEQASLQSTEQDILLNAVEAYMDIVRDKAVLDLNINNEKVIGRQLDASKDRYKVGEITRTDVSQAEARLQRAIADRIQAEGQYNASRASYIRVIGEAPKNPETPVLDFALPGTIEEAVAKARSSNPQITAAQHSERAARDEIDQVEADLRSSASLRASAGRYWNEQEAQDRTTNFSITAQIRIPLYDSGAASSRVREAKQTASQQRIVIEETERLVVERAIRAWEGLTTARATMESRKAQESASKVALEGIQQEAVVGSRTVLDVLDGEQELLDARVGLIQTERDEIVAAFELLAATGQLTVQSLGLAVDYYDPTKHHDKVRHQWWGTSTED